MQLNAITGTLRGLLCGAVLGLAPLTLAPATPAAAQNLFAPAIVVNDEVITGYELQQRERFLQVLSAPGNPAEEARRQLVEERLKLAEARRAGVLPGEEEMEEGMAEFAGRANLEVPEFIEGLASEGVAEETFRDFVRAGIAWRSLVRARFGGRSEVSEAEVDRALAGGGSGSNVRVLLSEIIIPTPPGQEERIMAEATRLSQITSPTEFAQAARRLSATQTRGAGGRLPWQEITRLPPQLRPILLGLAPGEVTDPIPLQGAVALFQLRAIEEMDYVAPDYAAIEYATYLIPGGRSEEALSQARRVRVSVDRCDDLYGVNKGQDPARLERVTLPPDEVPQDIALELAQLDAGEISTALTRRDAAGNPVLMMVMLCGRTPEVAQDAERGDVALSLRNRRLGSYAEGLLEQLRADARIIEQ